MRQVIEPIKKGISGVLDLLWPPHCAICNSRTEYSPLCDDCFAEIIHEKGFFCAECGTRQTQGVCEHHPNPAYSGFFPAFHFCDVVRELIHMLKYSNRRDIGVYFGEIIFQRASAEGLFEGIDGLVPIPLHKARKRERGYNQSEVIAQAISRLSGVPVLTKGIGRAKNTESQTKLNHEERQLNVTGAFKIDIDLTGKHFIIVDDVITTGATTRELAMTIARAGGRVAKAICIARPGLDD